MTILPVFTSTASEKLRSILLVVATAVASSAGENDEIVGLIIKLFRGNVWSANLTYSIF